MQTEVTRQVESLRREVETRQRAEAELAVTASDDPESHGRAVECGMEGRRAMPLGLAQLAQLILRFADAS